MADKEPADKFSFSPSDGLLQRIAWVQLSHMAKQVPCPMMGRISLLMVSSAQVVTHPISWLLTLCASPLFSFILTAPGSREVFICPLWLRLFSKARGLKLLVSQWF